MTKNPDTLEEEFGWLETDLRLGNAAFDGRDRLVRALEKPPCPRLSAPTRPLFSGRAARGR
jgi:protease III